MTIDYDTDIHGANFAANVQSEPRYAPAIASVVSAGVADPENDDVVTATDEFDINTTTVTLSGTSLNSVLADILAAGPFTPAVDARIIEANGLWYLVLASTQAGDTLTLAEATNTPLADLGIAASAYPSTGELPVGTGDQLNEERILTTIEVLASHMRLLRDRDEARLLHYCVSRMITKAGSGGFVYDNTVTTLIASVRNPSLAAADDIRIQVINPADGTDVVAATNVAAGGTTLAALIGAINGGIGGDDDLEASDNAGRLQLESRNGHTIVVLLGGANDEATRLAGVEPGEYKSKPTAVADDARDDALAFFATERREGVL